MRKQGRFPVKLIVEKNHCGDTVDLVLNGIVPVEKQAAKYAALLRVRDFQILGHSQVFINHRILEFSANPRTRDLIFKHALKMQTVELDGPVRWFGLAANHVEECRFPRTVRPDDNMQLVLLNIEVEVTNRLEAIERHRQVFN